MSVEEVHCTAPNGVVGYVAVEVSNNDAEYTESGVQFEYEEVMLVSVDPSSGVMSGGTEVTVMGEHLHAPGSKGLYCRFGVSLMQPATWQSTSSIRCSSVAQTRECWS